MGEHEQRVAVLAKGVAGVVLLTLVAVCVTISFCLPNSDRVETPLELAGAVLTLGIVAIGAAMSAVAVGEMWVALAPTAPPREEGKG